MDIDYEILQFFLYKKIIKKKEMDTIYAECKKQNIPADRYLVSHNICSEVGALDALGEYYAMPYVEMDMLEVDKDLLKIFNLQLLRKNKFVPIHIDINGVLIVATGHPMDFAGLSVVSAFYTGEVSFILVPPSQIDNFIDAEAAIRSTAVALEDLNSTNDKAEDENKSKVENITDEEHDAVNAPAVRLVNSIIKEAVPFRASDIHIEPSERTVRIRYRIDGQLTDRAKFPIESYPAISARLKILSGMNIAERRLPQDGRINMTINGSEYGFRVSTLPTVHGEKFVIRVLDKSAFNLKRAELGFTKESNILVDKMLARPHGIILMSGPTGCGKSTTLYTFLREVNSPNVNIVTVEDPVEYTMLGINRLSEHQSQPYFCQRPPLHYASGPGHYHDWGNTGRGNCPDCHTGGHYRPPCVFHHSCQRRPGCAYTAYGYGGFQLPCGGRAYRGYIPAACKAAVPRL